MRTTNFCAVFAIIVLLSLSSVVSGEQIVRVYDERKMPVQSVIRRGATYEDVEVLGTTNPDNGSLIVAPRCATGHSYYAIPETGLHYSRSVWCNDAQDEVNIEVFSHQSMSTLRSNAELAETAGRLGDAALAYSELASRISLHNPVESSELSAKAIQLFAKSINSPVDATVYDVNQNRDVMTPQFKLHLLQFQQSNGVTATGQLDARTLALHAELSMSSLIFKKQSFQ